MALSFGFVAPAVHRQAMERDMQRRRDKLRMSSDINSAVTASSSDAQRRRNPSFPVSPTSPGYNVTNVVTAAAVKAVQTVTKDKPLKGPDVGSDGFIIVSNPFYAEDE